MEKKKGWNVKGVMKKKKGWNVKFSSYSPFVLTSIKKFEFVFIHEGVLLVLGMEIRFKQAPSAFNCFSSSGWEVEPVARLNPERSIPAAVLKGAKGFAFIAVAGAGVVVAYNIGTGLLVERSDGFMVSIVCHYSCWFGMGCSGGRWANGLHNYTADKTFCSGCIAQLGLVVVLLLDRLLKCTAGSRCRSRRRRFWVVLYIQLHQRWFFVGVSLEGNVVATRSDTT